MEGDLVVGGVDPRSAPPGSVASRLGIVFQDPASQLVMSRVEDDVAFGLENRGWPGEAMATAVRDAIVAAGLGGLERRRTDRLSGGQQQRLALAGVLAAGPRLIVLDEPTANLDGPGTTALFERLAAVRAEGSTTMVLVEHRVGEAWPLADVVLALDGDGRPIDVGRPDEVLRRSGDRIRRSGTWLPDDAMRARITAPAARLVSSPAIVAATGVGFAYEPGAPVLADVDLSFGPRERVALVGPNGSGKSTLGRLLVGLRRPSIGRVRLLGEDPSRLDARNLARQAGYVFQDPETGFLAETVRDEVALGLTAAERVAVPGLMDQLGLPLESFGARSPYRLSGGEARRLSLACTLVRRPDLLVLDEPTFGQDRHGYEALVGILREHVDRGACVVTATHDERLVADVADRVVRLEAGRVVGDDAGAEAA